MNHSIPSRLSYDDQTAILLVEDDDNDAMLFQRALKKNHITAPFYRAVNGYGAEKFLCPTQDTAQAKLPHPRIVISDLKMPQMDGFELIEWMKVHPRCASVPIIVLSSSGQPEDVRKCFKLGANAYFIKPATAEGLINLVKTIWDFWSQSQIPLPVAREMTQP